MTLLLWAQRGGKGTWSGDNAFAHRPLYGEFSLRLSTHGRSRGSRWFSTRDTATHSLAFLFFFFFSSSVAIQHVCFGVWRPPKAVCDTTRTTIVYGPVYPAPGPLSMQAQSAIYPGSLVLAPSHPPPPTRLPISFCLLSKVHCLGLL